MLRLLGLPFVWGAGAPAVVVLAQWVHPITVRGVGTFTPRVRIPRVEFGHVEDPNDRSVSD